MSGSDIRTIMGGTGDGAEPPAQRIEVGTLLAHTYRVERRIGAGGMGEIYEAVNTITGAHAAIKAIRPELVSDETIAQLFVREAEALKSIRDPAVVGYEGVFRDELGRVFLAMEYIDGPSLAELIRGQPLSAEEVLRLGRRLARGLAAAHGMGVFHRDLSPDNILLPGGRLDDAVIIDFGIAKRQGASGPTLYGGEGQGFTGKYAYASPEQAGAVVAPIDGRSDLYSLALVLVAAVLGRPLPMGHDPLTAVAARQRRPDLSAVPQALRTVVEPLLAPDPKDRPSLMLAFAEQVERADRTPAGHPRVRPTRTASQLAALGGRRRRAGRDRGGSLRSLPRAPATTGGFARSFWSGERRAGQGAGSRAALTFVERNRHVDLSGTRTDRPTVGWRGRATPASCGGAHPSARWPAYAGSTADLPQPPGWHLQGRPQRRRRGPRHASTWCRRLRLCGRLPGGR